MGDNRGHSPDEDSANVTPSFQNILNAAVAKNPAFTVHVGDLFIGHSDLATTQKMYDVFKAAIQPLIAASSAPYPFTISPGNHEMRPACASTRAAGEEACTADFDPFALFNQEFPSQPQNGPSGYVGTTFSFDYGNSHFASIDACRFDANATTEDWDLYDLHDAVINWLDADLAAAQQAHVRHIFVFGHPEAWAPDGIRWSADSSGTQADLYAVANKVTVGSSGTILASQDGVTWSPQVSGTSATLRGIACGSNSSWRLATPVRSWPAQPQVAPGPPAHRERPTTSTPFFRMASCSWPSVRPARSSPPATGPRGRPRIRAPRSGPLRSDARILHRQGTTEHLPDLCCRREGRHAFDLTERQHLDGPDFRHDKRPACRGRRHFLRPAYSHGRGQRRGRS